nr:type III secretion system needle tip protein SctA [Chromobacterium amazonense]MDQ4541465.1 type III secretion system needle tip protein SctA [Chromobacterium amazonense]
MTARRVRPAAAWPPCASGQENLMTSIQTTITPPLMTSYHAEQQKARSEDTEATAAPALTAPSVKQRVLENVQAKADALSQALRSGDADERTLATQQFASGLNSLAASDVALTPKQRQDIQTELAPLPGLQKSSAGSTVFESDADLWDLIAKYIGNINKDYLGVYENVVGQYTAFYQAFSEILAKMGGWISPGSDSNKVKLDVNALKSALQQLQTKFSLSNKDAILFPAADSSGNVTGTTKKKAEEWADDLGLPRSCVKEQPAGSGEYVVVIDMAPINTMIDELNKLGTPGSDGKLELDNAKFQAWQSGFKSQEENLKNTLQTLTQKYSNANSLFDNLVKVLSSTISSCLETCKAFLQV